VGYTVIALCQTVNKKIEKNHVNFLDEILPGLKKRDGVLILKRLNIILDSDSEKGFGLFNPETNILFYRSMHMFKRSTGYDLISLVPTTQATFSQACLTHSQPSPLTAHIISLPLTLSRLPFHLKHTLIRTAIRNGAVFEINYVGALGAENDPLLEDSGAALNGTNAKRNWWASTRELCRVTKGKGIIVSGGASNNIDLRAPRDVGNIISLLGIPQNLAHDAMSAMPKSITIRAQTRMSYRAILSEPVVIIP
ncbi:RNase P subunit p30-domain-containing protein, partial [Flagelloscypha sp. PMI_526]